MAPASSSHLRAAAAIHAGGAGSPMHAPCGHGVSSAACAVVSWRRSRLV
jgi:hypothetical protein